MNEPADVVELFAIQREVGGYCSPKCQGQLCGDWDTLGQLSLAIYVNKYYQFVHESCNQAYMKTFWPSYNDPTKLSIGEVACKFNQKDVCQAPLISMQVDTIKVLVNGVEANLVLSIPMFRRWYWNNPDDMNLLKSTKNTLEMDIYFDKYTIVRGFRTAWNIKDVSIGFEHDGELVGITLDDEDEPWSFEHENGTEIPTSIPLPTSMVVKRLTVALTLNEFQISPFFDILGCMGEGNGRVFFFLIEIKSVFNEIQSPVDADIVVPSEDTDATFTYVLDHGEVFDIVRGIDKTTVLTYDDANELCKRKGGFLAVPESQEKYNAIKEAIKGHINKFNFQSPIYLIGM